MLKQFGDYLLLLDEEQVGNEGRPDASVVGMKARGLACIPTKWTPPYIIGIAQLYTDWGGSTDNKPSFLREVCEQAAQICSKWSVDWPKGLIVRSSAIDETLSQRGSYESIEITADFGAEDIETAIIKVYESFIEANGRGAIAVIIQARLAALALGHVSNERRVSSTVNQWMWEVESPAEDQGRFNSQRASAPDSRNSLRYASGRFINNLKQVAKWCNQERLGRVHLEWGLGTERLWIFQLDHEVESDDVGVLPSNFLRSDDQRKASPPTKNSAFKLVDFQEPLTGWSKIDKVRKFLQVRTASYPQICYITGDVLLDAMESGRDVAADIEHIAHGRAVCRTDCNSKGINRLNLPRTDSVTSNDAVAFMRKTIERLAEEGAKPHEICFIIHKFIPSCVAAWALADPKQTIVRVDALWGLPDGLQFLEHDTFEYDTVRKVSSSERIRYKPAFFQETESGEWKLIKVDIGHTRRRSLKAYDLKEIAEQTHLIAKNENKSIQIMWFCEISPQLNCGRNVPWFMMNPEAGILNRPNTISPGRKQYYVRSPKDLEKIRAIPEGKWVLSLEPEADYFRDNPFLKDVCEIAIEKNVPVLLAGSILSHAYYVLENSGVTVLTTDQNRPRSRKKKTFGKLVRDDIPKYIEQRGERVVLAHIAKSESRTALVAKLYEEAQELLAAHGPQDVTAELADILEVVKSLCIATGINWADVENAADSKREARGSFQHNVVLLETSWPTWAESHRSNQAGKIMPLKDLANVSVDGSGSYTISYPGVLAKGASNIIALADGRRIAVSLTNQGVKIIELPASVFSRGRQLRFEFE